MSPIAPQHASQREPRRRRFILPLAIGFIVVLGAGVLSLFVRDFVRQTIIIPVTYIAWLVDLVIRSIPQSAFWGAVVAAAILVTWRNLGSKRAGLILRRPVSAPILADNTDRSVFYTRLEYIARMYDSPFAREKLALELRLLIVKLLSHRERLPENEIERRVRTGELVTPPEVHALLTSWQTWLSPPKGGSPMQQLEGLWRRLLRAPTRATQPNAALEQRLVRAIDYMETVMNGGPLSSQPEEKHE
jgi:hypothetical protein